MVTSDVAPLITYRCENLLRSQYATFPGIKEFDSETRYPDLVISRRLA